MTLRVSFFFPLLFFSFFLCVATVLTYLLAFLLQLPPHLLDMGFPESDMFDSLVASKASIDRKMAESIQLWSQ